MKHVLIPKISAMSLNLFLKRKDKNASMDFIVSMFTHPVHKNQLGRNWSR